MGYWVDIPQENSTAFVNVAEFKTRKEAIEYAKEQFGANDKGMICLVTGFDEEQKGQVTR